MLYLAEFERNLFKKPSEFFFRQHKFLQSSLGNSSELNFHNASLREISHEIYFY